jgi:hypothetical protein
MDPTSTPPEDKDQNPPSSASEPTLYAELGQHCGGTACRTKSAREPLNRTPQEEAMLERGLREPVAAKRRWQARLDRGARDERRGKRPSGGASS